MPKKDQQPVYNAAGTHVYVITPSNGLEWECPVEVLDTYLGEPWNYQLVEPRDRSLDGLVDSTAEGDNQTGFDPSAATVAEINDHLAAHVGEPGEIVRVLELESAGKNRQGVKDPRLSDETPDA